MNALFSNGGCCCSATGFYISDYYRFIKWVELTRNIKKKGLQRLLAFLTLTWFQMERAFLFFPCLVVWRSMQALIPRNIESLSSFTHFRIGLNSQKKKLRTHRLYSDETKLFRRSVLRGQQVFLFPSVLIIFLCVFTRWRHSPFAEAPSPTSSIVGWCHHGSLLKNFFHHSLTLSCWNKMFG